MSPASLSTARRRALWALVLGCLLAAAFPGCDNVDTSDPTPADDDDGAGDDDDDIATSPTVNPSPSPTIPPLVGDPWTVIATPPETACGFGTIPVAFGNSAGVAVVGVAQTGSNIYFDIGLNNPQIGIGTAPSGTVDAGGNFTQTYSFCIFDGFNTRKFYADWTGTFTGGMTAFNDSTLVYTIYVRSNGDFRATCATSVDTSYAFGDCSSPGVTFSVDGVKQ